MTCPPCSVFKLFFCSLFSKFFDILEKAFGATNRLNLQKLIEEEATKEYSVDEEDEFVDARTGAALEELVVQKIETIFPVMLGCHDVVFSSETCNVHCACRMVFLSTSEGDSSCLAHARWLNMHDEANEPYDIEIFFTDNREKPRMFVEVKGTSAKKAELSASQVEFARDQGDQFVLVIVRDSVPQVFPNPVKMWQNGDLRADWRVRL